jgi:hypothetical protein
MILEIRFSSVSELTQRQKENGRPARKESSEAQKRALLRFEFVGERRCRHGLGIVTLFPNQEVAARHFESCSQTPNQSPEPTRWRGPSFVSGFSAHHRSYFESIQLTLARVAHL